MSLLKSCRFGLICASVGLMSCGSPYALYYLPAYTVAAGYSKAHAGKNNNQASITCSNVNNIHDVNNQDWDYAKAFKALFKNTRVD